VQSGNQHSDPKQIPDKLNCSRHPHILAMQLALVNDYLANVDPTSLPPPWSVEELDALLCRARSQWTKARVCLLRG
jgi:hypothetical protein